MSQVSIIIITHNRARYLQRAIESTREQTFGDFEIIVIDDASTDDTPRIIHALNEPRLRYLRQEKNAGEGASRNHGLSVAQSPTIAFLDDDDAWLPEKLERQVRLLDGLPAKVGGIYTGYFKVEMESQRMLGQVLPQKRGNLFIALSGRNWIGGPSTVLLRRECFDKVGGFDEELPFGADYDMWIRIARHYDFDYIADPLVLYAVHANQMSANTPILLRGKELQLRRYADYFATDKKAYSRFLLSLGVLYCTQRNLKKGRRAFLNAIKSDPFEVRPYFNLLLSFWGAANFARLKAIKEQLRLALAARRRRTVSREQSPGRLG